MPDFEQSVAHTHIDAKTHACTHAALVHVHITAAGHGPSCICLLSTPPWRVWLLPCHNWVTAENTYCRRATTSRLTMRLAWRGAAASSNDGRSPSRARPERPDVHAQDIGALLLERLWVRMAWRIRALLLHD